MKRKIDKYPYDNSKNLSEVEAIDNMVSAIDYLLELTRNYGPTTIIRIALIALSGNLIAFADLDTAPSPTLNPVNGICNYVNRLLCFIYSFNQLTATSNECTMYIITRARSWVCSSMYS